MDYVPFGVGNTLFYTYSQSVYWTMSPYLYNLAAIEFAMHTDSTIYHYWVSYDSVGIRPVINLAANVEITGGVGTQNNPYIIAVD